MPSMKKTTHHVTSHSPKGAHLTPAQRAEVITLWQAGDTTLADLVKRYKKAPGTFSSLFTKHGIKKGSAAAELAAKATAVLETRMLEDVEQHANRIAQSREQHYKMTDGLAKLAWSELVRARQAGLDIAGLKDLMQTLKLAGDVIGGARKELWTILGVDEHMKSKEINDLPELTVRELTTDEIVQLADAEEIDEMGGSMVPDLVPLD